MKPPLIPKILQPTGRKLPRGTETKNSPPPHLNIHPTPPYTHTHTSAQRSRTAVGHAGGGGCPADGVECLFPSTTGGTALAYRSTQVDAHSCRHAPRTGRTWKLGGQRGTQSGGCVSILAHIEFPSSTLEPKSTLSRRKSVEKAFFSSIRFSFSLGPFGLRAHRLSCFTSLQSEIFL